MSQTPKNEHAAQPSPPTTPQIPLPLELKAAYEALNSKYEEAIESTRDLGLLEALNASQTDVGNILTKKRNVSDRPRHRPFCRTQEPDRHYQRKPQNFERSDRKRCLRYFNGGGDYWGYRQGSDATPHCVTFTAGGRAAHSYHPNHNSGCPIHRAFAMSVLGGGAAGKPGVIKNSGNLEMVYSVSKPLLLPNFSVRLFSVTVRTTLSGTPAGISASISSVIFTFDPTRPTR